MNNTLPETTDQCDVPRGALQRWETTVWEVEERAAENEYLN